MKYTRTELAFETANRMAEAVDLETLIEAYVVIQENFYRDCRLDMLIEDATNLGILNPETDEVTDE